jgi:hypothetical protein
MSDYVIDFIFLVSSHLHSVDQIIRPSDFEIKKGIHQSLLIYASRNTT